MTQPVQRLLIATGNIWRFGRVERFCILYQLQCPSSSSKEVRGSGTRWTRFPPWDTVRPLNSIITWQSPSRLYSLFATWGRTGPLCELRSGCFDAINMFSVEHHRNKIDIFYSWLTIVEGLLAFSVLLVVVYLFIYFLPDHTESR